MTTVEIDGDEAESGLMALIVAVLEVLVESMEREAVRRMESGQLSDEEIERVGSQLASLEAEIERIKEEEGVEKGVDRLRDDLDGLVADALRRVEEPERGLRWREVSPDE